MKLSFDPDQGQWTIALSGGEMMVLFEEIAQVNSKLRKLHQIYRAFASIRGINVEPEPKKPGRPKLKVVK